MKKESLNEELNRIKKLMNFDIGENSHDVLSENVIKTVNHLNEQTTKPPHKNLLILIVLIPQSNCILSSGRKT